MVYATTATHAIYANTLTLTLTATEHGKDAINLIKYMRLSVWLAPHILSVYRKWFVMWQNTWVENFRWNFYDFQAQIASCLDTQSHSRVCKIIARMNN